jgi:WD40 repeat protein/predicted Ser/Thr protein kinase
MGEPKPNWPEVFPRTFGEYELLAEIARGGMGVVYRARQRTLDRVVALKMVLSGQFASRTAIERFRAEAQAAASLQHPNIVSIYEVGEAEGQPYFTMQFIEGNNLADSVRAGPLPARQAARYLEQIAQAIEFAHERGILHRDLKPSNVLIDAFDQLRITDFGLAKQMSGDSHLTASGQTLGSPNYMAPEQASGEHSKVGVLTDVYSLGALLYHLLTGRAPFGAGTMAETLDQVLRHESVAPRTLNPAVPVDVETICLKCLDKTPSRRYPTAKAVAEDLHRYLVGEPIVARSISAAERGWRWCRRRPAQASLVASGAMLLMAVTGASLVAAWRIELARRAQYNEREKAAHANNELGRANAHLAQTVTFLELQRAEAFFRSGDASMGLAHLAGVLRRDPSNHAAAQRIVLTLLHRNWVVPAAPPLQHPAQVNAVSFSPTGQYLVTSCADGFARLWDAHSRVEIGTRLKHPAQVRSACFSPDESSLATACKDGNVRIWNWRSGQPTVTPMKHNGWVFSVAFSPDGQRVVSACDDGIARVWSARTGEFLLALAGHTQPLRQAVFSPDGRLIATAGYDGSARLWNSQTGNAFGPVLRHGLLPVLGVAFSPDGSRVATSSRDRTAIVWNVATGGPLLPPLPHPDGLNDIQFDPTGRIIATTGFDNTVRLWDAQSGELLSQPFRHREQVNQAAFHPDGRTLATAADDWTVRFWEVRPGQSLEESMRHGSKVNWLEFSRDGDRLVTASDDSTAQVWDARSGLPLSAPMRHGGPVRTACFSPDGRFVATASTDFSPWIWEARTGNRLEGLFLHAARIWNASFSPEGRRLVTASADSTARIWDLDSKRPLTPPLQHKGAVFMARFSPDGSQVVTVSVDHTARVWDAINGAPITESLVHLDEVLDAQFSPDGLRVVTASKDNTARIWDPRTGQPIGRALQHLRTVQAVAFGPDGLRVVTASLDHTARIWDTATGEPVTPALQHDEAVLYARFSPDGQRVLTTSADRTARIWDAITGLPLSDPLWHKASVRMAQFSPDGERIATAAFAPDSAARIWQVPVAPSPVPDWLPALAESVAGLAVGTQGSIRLPESDFDRVRQRLNALTDNDAFSRVVRWFLADRATRTISPFQSEAVAQYVQRRIEENTLASLEEAIRLDPTNVLALARLAKAVLQTEPSGPPGCAAQAAFLAARARQFAPKQTEDREILRQIQQGSISDR